jgi:hypothetical protein
MFPNRLIKQITAINFPQMVQDIPLNGSNSLKSGFFRFKTSNRAQNPALT